MLFLVPFTKESKLAVFFWSYIFHCYIYVCSRFVISCAYKQQLIYRSFSHLFSLTVPGPPTELSVNHTSSSTALLRWAPVHTHLQHGVITGYIIRAISTQRNHSYDVDADTLEFEFVDLRANTEYSFSVAAATVPGSGSPIVLTSTTPHGGTVTAWTQ